MAIVEICVEGIESAMAAEAGGADRIELCEYRAVGGITPSAGTIGLACDRLRIPVHVLIRPRGGDFVHSDAEIEVMRRDIEAAKRLGAAGVVLGLLTTDRRIDRERTAELIALARPMSVTFHKGFDEIEDGVGALEELIGLGADRLLTSGGIGPARDHLGKLAEYAKRGAGRIAVLGGGSVTEEDIPKLIAAGLTEIHIGSAACSGGITDRGNVGRLVESARRTT